VVVVTVNHRLGALGYLYLGDVLGGAYRQGNAGLLDLVLALDWVRDNIARFGGDPDNITIFGESGGGKKVSHLLGMPAAQGLFHRAVIQSGALSTAVRRDAASDYARQFLDRVGVADDPAQLSTVSVERLVAAEAGLRADGLDVAGGYGGFGGPQPVVDGVTVIDHPGVAVRSGASADVPVMIGSTLDELALPPLRQSLSRLDAHSQVDHHAGELGAEAGRVVEHYTRVWPDLSPPELAVRIATTTGYRLPSARLALAKAAGGSAPVFVYVLAWDSGAEDGWIKAAHTIDVPLTMRTAKAVGPWITTAPGWEELTERMSRAWLAFARSGDPHDPVNPPWPAFTMTDRRTMVFDVDPSVAEDPFGDTVAFPDHNASLV
jgi:para-nitrobenzyl esterase